MPTNETEYPRQRNATNVNQIDQQMDLTTNPPPKQRLDLIFIVVDQRLTKGVIIMLCFTTNETAIEMPILHQECVHTSQSTQRHDLRQRTAIRIPRLQRHHRLITDQNTR